MAFAFFVWPVLVVVLACVSGGCGRLCLGFLFDVDFVCFGVWVCVVC